MKLCRIFASAANLQETPGTQMHISKKDSQMLRGELFRVEKVENNWAYGRSDLDGYTGWIDEAHLATDTGEPTHAVISLMTNVYTAPDFKTQPVENFSFMSRLNIVPNSNQGGFVLTADQNLWVPDNHLIAINDLTANPADIVDTAMLFNDCPYVYGGRSAQGLDCSGLVQLALQRNGISCPRDADQQEFVIGQRVPSGKLQRGDILFFPGHVGIMKDDTTVINATVRHMKVIVEPLADLIQAYGLPTSVRRLTP